MSDFLLVSTSALLAEASLTLQQGGLLVAVASHCRAIFCEFSHGPEQAPGDEVEVAVVGHGLIVVAQRGAEDPRFLRAIFIGPNHDGGGFPGFRLGIAFQRLFARALQLLSGCQSMSAVEHLNIVVKFLVDRCPVLHSLGGRMVSVAKADPDGQLRAVTGRLNADHFVPSCIVVADLYRFAIVAPTVAVHRAMQIHRRRSTFVSIENALHVGRIRYRC